MEKTTLAIVDANGKREESVFLKAAAGLIAAGRFYAMLKRTTSSGIFLLEGAEP